MPIQPHPIRPRALPPLAPRQAPARPDSPGTAHLKTLCADPHGAMATGLLPQLPAGAYVMPPATAEAARQFRETVLGLDPTGLFRTRGEFAQSYRMENGRVLPNGPIAYEAGSGVDGQPAPPGTFTHIHSHDVVPPPMRNDFPSPHDHLAARQAAQGIEQAHELMYHPASDRFFAYSGAVPPVFFEARFPPIPAGPAHGPSAPWSPPAVQPWSPPPGPPQASPKSWGPK